jgi:hypothetical protein
MKVAPSPLVGSPNRLASAVIALLSVFVIAVPIAVQGQTHIWSQSFGPNFNSTETGWQVVADPSGNFIMTGSIGSSTDFGGGSLAPYFYVVKFDPSGAHVWSKSTSAWAGQGVDVDASGNVFVTGHYTSGADFGGGSLPSTGGYEIFLVKYNSAGNHQWSKGFGGAFGSDDTPGGVTVDASGNVFLLGSSNGDIDFGGGPIGDGSAGQICLAKFDTDGTHLWSTSYGGPHGLVEDIDTDGSNIFISGGLADSVDFGGGFVKGGSYLAKFDTDGSHLWSKGLQGVTPPCPIPPYCTPAPPVINKAIAIDPSGNVWMTGRCPNNGDFDFGGGVLTAPGGAGNCIHLVKHDGAGAHLFSALFGPGSTTTSTSAYALATNSSGDVILAGGYSGGNPIDFGGGGLSSAGWNDVFLASFDANGSHKWSSMFGSTRPDDAYGLAVDGSDDVVMVGEWGDDGLTIDFGGGPLTCTLAQDIFIAKFGSPPTSVSATPDPILTLNQNHPNPFNPATTIGFSLDEAARVTLEIYDVTGRLVRRLVDRRMSAGAHSEDWNGLDDRGGRVASGTYFYRLTAGTQTLARKAVLLK